MAELKTGVLVILDGFGVNPENENNAVAQANTPTLTRLTNEYDHGEIDASESHVGLPTGFMGNSEVGHLNIGAGRIVYQDFSLISHAIETEDFYKNEVWINFFKNIPSDRTVHLIGLVSDGGVHSHLSHLLALIKMAKLSGVSDLAIHVITDGRDTPPSSAISFIEAVKKETRDFHLGRIVSVSGRFYAMDRDKRWDRVEKAYRAIVVGDCDRQGFEDPVQYIRSQYEAGNSDEFILPAALKGYKGISDGDRVGVFNFRADRARELVRALSEKNFDSFKREFVPALSSVATMTQYDASLPLPFAFSRTRIKNTLGEVVSKKGWKQIRIAETEKYAHVTYFFNGGEETPFPGEDRKLIPSPKEVKTYDLKPEMSALEVTEEVLKALQSKQYQFLVVNFANPDMVGHTGNLRAATLAVETIDKCLEKIVHWIEKSNAFMVLTADHGNCEKMVDDSGLPLTSHTTLPVPVILVDSHHKNGETLPSGGRLCDIAPTILTLFGISKPSEMTGKSLI